MSTTTSVGAEAPVGVAAEAPPGACLQLALATAAFAVTFFAWALLGPLSPHLQEDLGLSDTQTSMMVAVPVLLGSLMRIPLGWLSDRVGGRIVFAGLLAFTPLPLLALAFWHGSLGALLIFGLLLGFAGASFAIGIPFVNGWYPPAQRGFALGAYGMGTGGTAVAAFVAPRVGGVTTPFWIAIALLLVMLAVWLVFARNPPQDPSQAAGPRPGMLASLTVFGLAGERGRAWSLTLFYFLAFGGFVALFLYLPKMLVGVHELTKSDAGARAAGFAMLAVIARPTGGWLADRIGAERVLRCCFAGVTLFALILAVSYKSMVPLTICCLASAIALGLGTGAVFKLVPEWFPTRVGAVTGVVGAAGGLGGFFPPLVMGVVMSATGSYALGFVLMAVLAVICMAVLFSTGRHGAGAAETASEH